MTRLLVLGEPGADGAAEWRVEEREDGEARTLASGTWQPAPSWWRYREFVLDGPSSSARSA